MKGVTRPVFWTLGTTLLVISLVGLPAAAQVAASPDQQRPAGTLEDSVQTLAEELKQLNASVLELRTELTRSRQETRELREQLHSALEKIATASERTAAQNRSALSAPPAPPAAGLSNLPPAEGGETERSARLDRLQENQELLNAKVDDLHQTKVESASKYRVKLSGIALLNVFENRGQVDNLDVPTLALPKGALASGGSFGATVRQSEVGLEAYGPTLAGARASGDLHFDFFGGFPDISNGVSSGLVRLRTGTVRLDWAATSIVAGQDAPFFSPLSPTSIASLAYPAFSDSGNLWTWTPQVRVEQRLILSSRDNLLIQGGILDPLSGEAPYFEYLRTPQAGEQSRQPADAVRLAWSHGDSANAITLGVGGYYSRQNYGAGQTEDAWASTADWSFPFRSRWSLTGEFYRGRALGGLGAAEGRSVLLEAPDASPTPSWVGLNTVGGWTQLKFKASEALEFNAAYGEDNPFARDLRYSSMPTSNGYTSVSRNQSEMVNVIYRPRTDLLFSLEFRHLNTRGIAGDQETANHVNLGVGVLF